MPRTENQKAVTAYLSLDLYELLKNFKLDEGLKSDSQAIAAILEQFFAAPTSLEGDAARDSTDLLDKRLKNLEQTIAFVQADWRDKHENILEIIDDLLARTKFLIPQVNGDVPSTVDGSVPSTVDGSVPSTVNGSVPSTVDDSVPSTVDDSVPSTVDDSVPSTVDDSVPSTVDDSVPSTVDDSVPSTVDGSVPSTVDGSVPSTVDGSVPSTVDGSVPSTVDGSVPSTVDGDGLNLSSEHFFFDRFIICALERDGLDYWTGKRFSPDIRNAQLYSSQKQSQTQAQKLQSDDSTYNIRVGIARNLLSKCLSTDFFPYSLEEILDSWKVLEDRKQERKSARKKAASITE